MHSGFTKYLTDSSGLAEHEAQALSEGVSRLNLKRGEQLIRPGSENSATYFVEKGLLKLYQLSEHGKEHVIQFACENWFISDRNSVHFNAPAVYFIDAIEDSVVVPLSDSFLRQASQQNTAFQQFNERALQNHIRHLQNRIAMLLGATAEARYLEFLTMYPNLLQRIPQRLVASYLGITPESLSRVRKALAKK